MLSEAIRGIMFGLSGGLIMILYVTRHGETDANALRQIQGRRDIPLNATGIAQAEELKTRLKTVRFDRIYTSPLSRARKTAEIVNSDRQVPLIVDDRLIEMSYGDLEGTSTSSFEAYERKDFSRYPHGESFLDVAARVYPFIDELKRRHPDETILIVGHIGVDRIIASYFESFTNDGFRRWTIPNCSVLRYEI
jgi:probable phosphoglycerate mutase